LLPALAYGLGVLLYHAKWWGFFLLWPFWMGFGLFLLSALIFKQIWLNRPFITIPAFMMFFAFLGFFRSMSLDPLQKSDHYLRNGYSVATAIECKVIREMKSSTKGRYEVQLTQIQIDNIWEPISGKVLLQVPDASTVAKPGSRLWAMGYFKDFSPPSFPGGFDYGAYMHQQQVYRQFQGQFIEISEPGAKAFSIVGAAGQVRAQILMTISNMPISETGKGLAAALLVGYRDWVSADHRSAFASAGTMHVLAVSGLHVGIVYIVLVFLLGLNRSPYGKSWKVPILLSAIWFYAFIAGLSPSVMRAAAMFSFFAFGQLMGKNTNSYNMMLAAGFLLMWLNPSVLFSVGFQLSFAAVWGIVSLVPLMQSLWQPKHTFFRRFRDLILVSIAAQLATMPFTWYYFNQFPSWFLLGNLLVLPIIPVVMYVGGLAVLSSYYQFTGHDYLAKAFGILLDLVNWSVGLISELPGAVLHLAQPSGLLCLLLAIAILIFPLAFKPFKFAYLVCSFAGLVMVSAAVTGSFLKKQQKEAFLFLKDQNQLTLVHQQGVCAKVIGPPQQQFTKQALLDWGKQEGIQNWVVEENRTTKGLITAAGDTIFFEKTGSKWLDIQLDGFQNQYDLTKGNVVIQLHPKNGFEAKQLTPYRGRIFF
jgi:competence protein ComEC